jgi:hypothetical protein
MTVQLRYDLFLNAKTIYEPKMAVDDIFSVKTTDGENLDNNPSVPEVRPKEANQNLIPTLSTNEYKQLKEPIRENGPAFCHCPLSTSDD